MTAGNFGPIVAGGTGTFSVTFAAATAGVLAPFSTGQVVRIANNFDNVAEQNMSIVLGAGAAAYNLAAGNATPSPAGLANQRVGGALTQALTVSNRAPAGSFTEGLNVSFGTNTGDALNNGGTIGLLAGQANNSSAMTVRVNTSSAGAKTGTVALNYVSDGTGTSGLGLTNVGSQTITVSGSVYNMAQGSATPSPINLGNFRVGQAGGVAPQSQNVTVTNTVAGPFTESLGIGTASVNNAAFTLTNNLGSGVIAAGGNNTTALNVARTGGSAGLNTGQLAIQYTSDGAGTSGLAAINSNTQNLTVNATGYVAASGLINTAPLNFGTVQVGQAVAQTLSISNTAPAGAFSEDLNASFGAPSGTSAALISGSGSISGLLAGATNTSGMTVSVNTTAAGTVTGAIAVNFASAGAVGGTSNGLGTLGVGSANYGVSGLIQATVINTASPVINTPTIALGNVRVGATAPTQFVSVTNQATTAPQAALNASISTGAPLTASGSFNLLDPGATNATSLQVGMNTATAGSRNGTATVAFVSDASNVGGCAPNCQLNLPSQNVTVTGGVYNVAVGTTTPTPVTIANQRVSGTNSQVLTVANTAPTGAFSEALNATFSGVSGPVTNNGGSVTNLIAGGTNGTAMSVGVDTTTAGAKGGSRHAELPDRWHRPEWQQQPCRDRAGSQTINVSGNVYRLATGQFNTAPLNFGTVQVGQAVSQTLSISNIATGPAGFVEDLNARFGTSSGTGAAQILGSGSISGLLAGATTSSGMTVSVNTGTAGTIGGAIAVNFFSAGAVAGTSNGLGELGVGLASYGVSGVIEAQGQVINQALPVINTPTIALGNVRVGATAPTQFVSVTNQATTAPQAALNASISTGAPLTASGSFNLLDPGATNATSLQVGMNTATAGSRNGTATVAFVSDASNVGGCAPNCQLTLPSQNVTVTGGVYQVAQPDVPATVNLGNFRLGSAPSQAITIGNINNAPATFQEGLDASVGGTSGKAIATGGPISNLVQGGSSTAISVGINSATATAGATNTGQVTINLASNGSTTSGLPTLDLTPATITVNATGYNVAVGSATPSPITLGNFRVGQAGGVAPQSQGIAITNTVAGPFTESLGVGSASVNNAAFNLTNAIGGSLVAAGATTNNALTIARTGGSAGVNSGTIAIQYTSDGAGTSGLAAINSNTQNLTVNATGYVAASGLINTAPLNFGTVQVGQAVSQTLSIYQHRGRPEWRRGGPERPLRGHQRDGGEPHQWHRVNRRAGRRDDQHEQHAGGGQHHHRRHRQRRHCGQLLHRRRRRWREQRPG